MTVFHPGLAEVVRRDPRYAYEAYEFVFYALHHTQKNLGREPPAEAPAELRNGRAPEPHHHVSGPELLDGIRELALREYGRMARTVFRLWGIERTDDFGEIVFNLIEAGMMSQTAEDSRRYFQGVYDLDRALVEGFRFQLDEVK